MSLLYWNGSQKWVATDSTTTAGMSTTTNFQDGNIGDSLSGEVSSHPVSVGALTADSAHPAVDMFGSQVAAQTDFIDLGDEYTLTGVIITVDKYKEPDTPYVDIDGNPIGIAYSFAATNDYSIYVSSTPTRPATAAATYSLSDSRQDLTSITIDIPFARIFTGRYVWLLAKSTLQGTFLWDGVHFSNQIVPGQVATVKCIVFDIRPYSPPFTGSSLISMNASTAFPLWTVSGTIGFTASVSLDRPCVRLREVAEGEEEPVRAADPAATVYHSLPVPPATARRQTGRPGKFRS